METVSSEVLDGEREVDEREWIDFCLVRVMARASSAWRSICGECGGRRPRERPSEITDDDAGPNCNTHTRKRLSYIR